jgi:GAF domain-containing protein
MALPDDRLHELAALAGAVLAQDDLRSTLREICRVAARTIETADGASLTSLGADGPNAVASSDQWAESLDELQYEEREGPCFDAARGGLVFRVRDIEHEARWPTYMPRALEQGARSMVSIPMVVESKTVGALNIYSKATDAFDAEDVSLGEILAAHAGLAAQVASSLFRHKTLADQLQQAMETRPVIEQAKGILMAQSNVGPDEAFELLKRASQRENRKLHDVARDLTSRYPAAD